MNFVWFVIASICFYILYWFLLSMIIFLPSMPIMGLVAYLSENSEKKWAKIAIPPTFVLAFLFGTLLPCAIFGMGMGLIASRFGTGVSLSFIYYILAGIAAFTISAPSGETSFFGSLISLGAYLLTIFIPRLTRFSEAMMDTLYTVAFGGLVLLVVIGVIVLVINFVAGKIRRRKATQRQVNQGSKKRLSVGVYIISILFIILGGNWVLSYFVDPRPEMAAYFTWGVCYLVGGIGMLARKYWALIFSRVFLIVGVVPALFLIPGLFIGGEKPDSIAIVATFVLMALFFGLPIWFLFRKSTKRQFKGDKADSDKLVVEKFQDTLKKHVDQLFGIRLYYEGIRYEYGDDDVTMATTKMHFENIIERGEKIISAARILLQEVWAGQTSATELENFKWLPISGHPGLDDLTVRAQLLVETYERLFPNRSRETPLTSEEQERLMTEAAGGQSEGNAGSGV